MGIAEQDAELAAFLDLPTRGLPDCPPNWQDEPRPHSWRLVAMTEWVRVKGAAWEAINFHTRHKDQFARICSRCGVLDAMSVTYARALAIPCSMHNAARGEFCYEHERVCHARSATANPATPAPEGTA